MANDVQDPSATRGHPSTLAQRTDRAKPCRTYAAPFEVPGEQ